MRTTVTIAALLSLAAAAPAMADSMTVQLDHSAKVSLSGNAANVFVGNASIADAIVIDRHNLVVVGKGYGVTNILVLDGAGRTILNRRVQVSSSDDGRVTMFEGTEGANYTCSPACEHTPLPGEANATYNAYAAPYQAYQSRATGSGGQTSAGGAPGNP